MGSRTLNSMSIRENNIFRGYQ